MNQFTCSKCDICLLNNHLPMIGDGNLDANIMFVTRNPNNLEMKNNIPLFDKAGMLFQDYLNLFNFSRDLIYITNAVKCRTPGNRLPTDKKIYNCQNYLQDEINEIKPKIVVLLGDTAIRTYFKLAYSILSMHSDELNSKYIVDNNRIILFMIHPNYALYSNENRIAMFNSFKTLLTLYRIINPGHTVNFVE